MRPSKVLSPIPPRGNTHGDFRQAPMAQGLLESVCRLAPRGESKVPGSIPGTVATPPSRVPPFGLRSKNPPGFFVATNLPRGSLVVSFLHFLVLIFLPCVWSLAIPARSFPFHPVTPVLFALNATRFYADLCCFFSSVEAPPYFIRYAAKLPKSDTTTVFPVPHSGQSVMLHLLALLFLQKSTFAQLRIPHLQPST